MKFQRVEKYAGSFLCIVRTFFERARPAWHSTQLKTNKPQAFLTAKMSVGGGRGGSKLIFRPPFDTNLLVLKKPRQNRRLSGKIQCVVVPENVWEDTHENAAIPHVIFQTRLDKFDKRISCVTLQESHLHLNLTISSLISK